jgi:hypothetical protein
MDDDFDSFMNAVQALSRERVLEAILALDADTAEESSAPSVGEAFLSAVNHNPFAALPDVDALARLSLIAVGIDPTRRAEIRAMLGETGEKAVSLGSADIRTAALAALVALQLALSHGVSSETLTYDRGVDEQGRVTVHYEEETKYVGVSEIVGTVVSEVSKVAGGASKGAEGG